jgi:purine-nucleoside phosphorylase
MASGMGMPSMGIYSYELFSYFGVNNIIRVGTAGALQTDIQIRDIVIAMGCSTDSNYAASYKLPGTFAPICSYELLSKCVDCANEMGATYHIGNLMSTDVIYGDDDTAKAAWAKMGVMAIDMEGAALYMNAARLKKNALVICTISNHLITGEETTAEERQSSFDKMITLALESAIKSD